MSVLNYSPKYDTISGVNEMYEYIKNSWELLNIQQFPLARIIHQKPATSCNF
jgi:hypothetical protein